MSWVHPAGVFDADGSQGFPWRAVGRCRGCTAARLRRACLSGCSRLRCGPRSTSPVRAWTTPKGPGPAIGGTGALSRPFAEYVVIGMVARPVNRRRALEATLRNLLQADLGQRRIYSRGHAGDVGHSVQLDQLAGHLVVGEQRRGLGRRRPTGASRTPRDCRPGGPCSANRLAMRDSRA